MMNQSSQKINLAVIGCGHWGPNHIRNFSTHPLSHVSLCADLNLKRLEEVREMFPGVVTTTDIDQVLADPRVDAVVISTPTMTHFDLTRRALEAGKHVLCEKPLAAKASEAAELMHLAKKVGKILMVGHVFLFNAGIVKLRELLMGGDMGRVYYLHATRTNLGPIRQDVDCVWDLATHDIAIFNFLLGSEPTEVSARGSHYLQDGKADVAFVTLTYPNQILANIHVSWLDPKKVRQLTIVADHKMVTWDDMATGAPVTIYDKGIVKEPFYKDFGEFQLVTKDGDILIPKVKASEPLRVQTNYFLSGIQTGQIEICTATQGWTVVRVLEAIQTSMLQGGAPVRILP